jgi:putative NADPH-quinone reductase
MKTLVIVIHPNLKNSTVNKRWMEELKKHPEKFTVHELYDKYPDEQIDVLAEQQLIEQYNKVVFQFPFYWFNCPPLFKKWLDEVLTYGWAFGSKSGYKLSGKKIALAISLGGDELEYGPFKRFKYTLHELTRPFELTFEYVKADYKPFFAFYGIDISSTKESIETSVQLYLNYLESL